MSNGGGGGHVKNPYVQDAERPNRRALGLSPTKFRYWGNSGHRKHLSGFPLSDNSGQNLILTGDGLSANDPKRKK
jgi:hypothetical protein